MSSTRISAMNEKRLPRTVISTVIACVAAVALATEAAAQERARCPVAQPGRLVLYGDIPAPIVLTEADLLAMPQVTVEDTPHGGGPSVYVGPRLEDVLAGAGLPWGQQLRGSEMSRYVVVEAVDGYRALYALAELDSAFQASTPLLALRQNGSALDSDSGPFQIIVPGERRHGRWVRQVACIRIARDRTEQSA
jgi:DMSO/TMAO reductase YedYZ molybdopterin-dependent catalytic subunit